MTSAIVKVIDRSDLVALHSVYVALHRAHKTRPKLFTVGNCTTAVTALMSFNTWAWRVVGLTPAALEKYNEQGFKHQSKQGITRAHLRPRISTVADLLAHKQPMTAETFIRTLLRHDATVLCVSGENKGTVPPYIRFANANASLFASKKIGWTHSKKEEVHLRRLYADHVGLTAPSAVGNVGSMKKGETMKRPMAAKVRVEPYVLRLHFVQELLDAQGTRVPQARWTPDKRGILHGNIGRARISFKYVTLKNETRVELLFQTEDAKEQLHKLKQNREAIEAAFGGRLDWLEKEGFRQCRVVHMVAGGYCSPRSEWRRIHDNLIVAMIRLVKALATYIGDAPVRRD